MAGFCASLTTGAVLRALPISPLPFCPVGCSHTSAAAPTTATTTTTLPQSARTAACKDMHAFVLT